MLAAASLLAYLAVCPEAVLAQTNSSSAAELFTRPAAGDSDAPRPFPTAEALPASSEALDPSTFVSPFEQSPPAAPAPQSFSLFDDPDRGVQHADARSDELPRAIDRVAAEAAPVRRISTHEIAGEPIAAVRIEGNRTIPTYAIERLITETRAGRPVSPEQVLKDKTKLVSTRWFLSVRDRVELTEAGPVVVFEVIEAPILEKVTFIGNDKGRFSKFNDEKLSRETGLVPGHGFDVSANHESVQRIRQMYLDKGYNHVQVTLEKGGHSDDREVVIKIVEGPRVGVSWVSFEGNEFASGALLRQHIETSRRWLGFIGGDFNEELIRNDVLTLKTYYEQLGFFDVDVQYRTQESADKSDILVTFTIKEGQRYKVRSVELAGNQVLGREQLLGELKLKPGDAFNSRFLAQDTQAMKDKYDELGRTFASVTPTPRFLPEPGWLDLVYTINEDKVCRVGRINIRIRGDETHTRTDAVRHRINRYLKPGALARAKDIQAARTIISTDPIFDREDPPNFNIRRVSGDDYLSAGPIARGQDVTDVFAGRGALRPASMQVDPQIDVSGQNPLWSPPSVAGWFEPHRARDVFKADAAGPQAPEKPSPERDTNVAPAEGTPMTYLPRPARLRKDAAPAAVASTAGSPTYTLSETLRPALLFDEIPALRTIAGGRTVRAQSIDGRGLPNPQNYLFEDSNQGDPFGNAIRGPVPDFVDVDIDVTEGRTGRLMFGAGVNSNAGLVGNLVLQEDNFDILAFPRHWGDVIHGRAFRGGGQSFRIEAVPGTQVSRYTASWRTPYFLGTDFSFGVDGFYYNRFFQNWTEDRTGGRVSLGYIINRYWTAGVTLRMENVEFRDFLIVPQTPQSYLDVAGDNFLSTVQFRINRDTRDSPFLPSKGNFIEFAYEQAFGEFTYPRFDLTGSQYFTLYERADGTGKHTLMLRGETTWTGDDTPVFERLQAGGFQSFRGFAFRGVTPRENSFRIGGQFLAIGTAEYQFPLTAGDGIRGVLFSDFGTVDTEASFDKFRATAGFGLRFFIPAMGPAPLAFDFAWPIFSETEDTEQVFSFYIGTTF